MEQRRGGLPVILLNCCCNKTFTPPKLLFILYLCFILFCFHGIESEIQQPRKRFLDSSICSPFHSWLMPWRHPRHPDTKNPLQYPWIDNCLMETGPLVVELTLVKCHWRLFVYLGQTSNPSSAWKKVDVKIDDDDDDDERSILFQSAVTIS